MADKASKRKGAAAVPSQGHWATVSEAHDQIAAAAYLSLSLSPDLATVLAEELLRSPLVVRRANDLLRASGLALLGRDDARVAKDLKRLKRGESLAPVLLVRGDMRSGRALVVADGYHRICASYHVNEETDIPCRIAELSVVVAAAQPIPTVGSPVAKGPARRPARRATAKVAVGVPPAGAGAIAVPVPGGVPADAGTGASPRDRT